MSPIDVIAEFRSQVLEAWLPTFCRDPKRCYELGGFQESSIRVAEVDASDCLRAINGGVVTDRGGGRYRARKSTADEQLFWTGSKTKVPRPITLWLEPVITFASLARLHFDHGWPVDLLASQPQRWAFDVAAHFSVQSAKYRILGEIKKSVREAEALLGDLTHMTTGGDTAAVRHNSRKKWLELLASKPPVLWIVGPGGFSKVLAVAYPSSQNASLVETTSELLSYDAV